MSGRQIVRQLINLFAEDGLNDLPEFRAFDPDSTTVDTGGDDTPDGTEETDGG